MVNKVILLGHVGRTPVVHTAPAGTPVAGFSLATSRQWRKSDGTLREHNEWHAVVCYGRYAEIAGEHLTSGRQLYVEGRIRTRSWVDRHTGQTLCSTEIICERFLMLGVRPSPGTPAAVKEDSEPPESPILQSPARRPGGRPLAECESMSQLASTVLVR